MTLLKTLHTYRIAFSALLAGLLLLMLGGCSGNPQYTDYHAFLDEPKMPASSQPYLIGPPDMLQITSSRVNELNNYQQVVTPDGYIDVPLLGRIYVAGRTTQSLKEELEERAQFYYQDADVSVRVSRYASKKLFVFGQVASPGPYFYNGSNTILDTLARAQPTDLADPTSVVIIRPDEEGELRARMTVDLDRMVRTGDTTLNTTLQDGDIVYVPASGVGKVALTFRQILLPLQPIAQTVTTPRDISRNTTGDVPYGEKTSE